MQMNDAKAIINKKFPHHKIDKIKETKTYFLVHIIPEGKSNTMFKMSLSCDDSLMAVDKRTGKVFTYNPIRDRE